MIMPLFDMIIEGLDISSTVETQILYKESRLFGKEPRSQKCRRPCAKCYISLLDKRCVEC